MSLPKSSGGSPQFEIRSLTPSANLDDLSKLMSLSFSRNPLRVAVGATAELLLPEFQRVVQKAAREPFSYVAIDKATQKIVSFHIGEDLANVVVKKEAEDPRLQAIDASLLCLMPETENLKPREILHFLYGGTADGYEQHGLITRMMKIAIEDASKLGFRSIVIETTHPGSQKVVGKMGFKEDKVLGLDGFEWPRGSGRRPFLALAREFSPRSHRLELGNRAKSQL